MAENTEIIELMKKIKSEGLKESTGDYRRGFSVEDNLSKRERSALEKAGVGTESKQIAEKIKQESNYAKVLDRVVALQRQLGISQDEAIDKIKDRIKKTQEELKVSDKILQNDKQVKKKNTPAMKAEEKRIKNVRKALSYQEKYTNSVKNEIKHFAKIEKQMKSINTVMSKSGGMKGGVANVLKYKAMQGAIGDKAFKKFAEHKQAEMSGGAAGKVGKGGMVAAATGGAIMSILSTGAKAFTSVLVGGAELASKSFNSGIQGAMQGVVDATAGLAGVIPLIGGGLSKIVSAVGSLLISVRMFKYKRGEVLASRGLLEKAITGKGKGTFGSRVAKYGALGTPELTSRYATAMIGQGMRSGRRPGQKGETNLQKFYSLSQRMGMGEGEGGATLGKLISTTEQGYVGAKGKGGVEALKNMSLLYGQIQKSASISGINAKILAQHTADAAVHARALNVDFKDVNRTMHLLVLNRKAMRSMGVDLTKDSGGILGQLVGKKGMTDTQHAFIGSLMGGGKGRGAMAQMMLSKFGIKPGTKMFDAEGNLSKTMSIDKGTSVESLKAMKTFITDSTKDMTGGARYKAMVGIGKTIGLDPKAVMALAAVPIGEIGNKFTEEFKTTTATAKEIAGETQKVAKAQYDIQVMIERNTGVIAAAMKRGDIKGAGKSTLSLFEGLIGVGVSGIGGAADAAENKVSFLDALANQARMDKAKKADAAWNKAHPDSYRETKATGGPVSPNASYVVGERGPEILNMGSSGGSVTPSLNGAGNGSSIINNFYIEGHILNTSIAEHLAQELASRM